MKKTLYLIPILGILFLGGCIGNDIIDDRVDPVVRITNPVDTIEVNTSYQFEASFFNNVGKQEMNNLTWKSSDENTISIS
ncbi:MAG TPA: hypothetical protein ENJ53_05780, partial [Phaeodactylibacter sp.]|nr:hypothetical protein [Phaeodactylibacter sp.]